MAGQLITVDSHELSAFARELAAIDPKLRVLLRRQMAKAGQGARDAIAGEADWSSRIPGATRVKVSFAARGAGVAVVVDRKKAPEARVLDHGGKPGTFRHPVHESLDPAQDDPRSKWTWVDQDARPFFEPGAEKYSLGRFQGLVEETAQEVSVLVVGL